MKCYENMIFWLTFGSKLMHINFISLTMLLYMFRLFHVNNTRHNHDDEQ